MKVVILAGGLGTRLTEETELKPKPMVEIGGRPILWHIMKHYAFYGFSEFVMALVYRGDDIKRFFVDYVSLSGDLTVDVNERSVTRLDPEKDDWKVHLVETGPETGTGGRIGRISSWLAGEPFMLTYGDGVSDVDLAALVEYHRRRGGLATV